MRDEYIGNEQLHVGNGTSSKISYVGDSKISTASHALFLRDILHVPEITKNLSSVVQFTSDNDVVFEFHPGSCLVKDRATRKVLLDGTLEQDFYKILPNAFSKSPIQPQALLTTTSSFELWHNT